MDLLSAIAAAGGALLGFAGLLAMRSRRVRPESFRRTRRAEEATDDRRYVARMKSWLQVHDALTDTLVRRRLARTHRRYVRAQSRLPRLRARAAEMIRELQLMLKVRLDAEAAPAPSMSPRLAAVINYAFLLPGDMVIVASALTSRDGELSPLLALISSAALAAAVWLTGKWLGVALGADERTFRAVTPPLIALSSMGIALGYLRLSDAHLWVILSLTPAIGSAIVTMQSRNPAWDKVLNSERRFRTKLRRYHRTARSLGRGAGRTGAAYSDASTRITAKLVALTNSIAAEVGAAKWPHVASAPVAPLRETLARLGLGDGHETPTTVALDAGDVADEEGPDKTLADNLVAFFEAETRQLDALLIEVLASNGRLDGSSDVDGTPEVPPTDLAAVRTNGDRAGAGDEAAEAPDLAPLEDDSRAFDPPDPVRQS